MLKSIKLVAAASVVGVLLTGLTYAAARPVPKVQPQVALQTEAGIDLPGDALALDQALQADGPVKYKVLVVDSTNGEDKTAYLDRVASEWEQPAANSLLLVVFTQDNYDIRFYLGATFREHGVTVDDMLQLVRGTYLPKARQQDAAGGLTALIGAVNERIGGQAAQAKPAPVTAPASSKPPAPAPTEATPQPPAEAPAPTTAQPPAPAPAKPQPPAPAKAQRPAPTPANPQSEIAQSLLTSYLTQFKSEQVGEAERLTDFRFNVSDLAPTDATANRIRFQVKFDVLPTSTHASAWLAGNGRQEPDGWMVDNNVIMTAVKQGASWKLDSFTTGP